MYSHLGTTVILLVSCLAQAQTPATVAPVHPSNGVLELSAEPVLGPDRRPESERHDVYGPWAGLIEISLVRRISG